MSLRIKLLVVLLVVAVLIAATVVPVHAAKGGVKGKPEENATTKAPAVKDKGQVAKSSNGSGDKKDSLDNGKNRAKPDEDGVGADHGVVTGEQDKQWDGNNGCGNDKLDPNSPFEDDNNGKCKGLHKSKDGPDAPDSPGTPDGPDTPNNPPDGPDSPDTPDVPEDDRVRVCFHSHGNAVEISNVIDAFDLSPEAFEMSVITEAWDVSCFDASHGDLFYVLGWNSSQGHSGPRYRVQVGKDAPSHVEIHNPIYGTVEIDGVTVTRLNQPINSFPAAQ